MNSLGLVGSVCFAIFALFTNINSVNAQNSYDQFLIGHWKFDETTGTTAVDETGNNNGTINTAHVTLGVEGVTGTAYSFDGTDDNLAPVNMGDGYIAAEFEGNKDLTWAYWAKMESDYNGNRTVISLCSSASSNKYIQAGQESGYPYGKERIGDGDGTKSYCRGNTSFQDLLWHHIVYVIDADQGHKLYVDGELQSSDDLIRLNATSTFNRFAIGCLYRGDSETKPTDYFVGKVDDVKVFNAALTQDEVKTLFKEYNYTPPSMNDNLTGYWNFNNADNIGIDSSDYNNAGTASNISLAIDSVNGTCAVFDAYVKSTLVINGSPENTPELYPQNEFTLGFWFKTDMKDEPVIVAQQLGNIIPLEIIGDGTAVSKVITRFNGGAGEEAEIKNVFSWGGGNYATNYWHHLSMTFTGADNKATLKTYIDGKLLNATSKEGNELFTVINNQNNPWVFGGGVNDSGYYSGSIDEIKMLNKALSDIEVDRFYKEFYQNVPIKEKDSVYIEINIADMGAIGDGETMNTTIIQHAIDSISENGFGAVVVPEGTFLTGKLYMKADVELRVLENGVLLGSTNIFDYKINNIEVDPNTSLLYAKNVKNIAVTGKGVIDQQGTELVDNLTANVDAGLLVDADYPGRRPAVRPKMIIFDDCDGITLKNITLKDGSNWVCNLRKSKNILIDSMRVESNAYWNNDGIDIDGCQHVIIRNCYVNCTDDGICLKSNGYGSEYPCEDILIENCTIRSGASALKFGTPSFVAFKDITVRNLYIYDTYRSAIALEAVDGGFIENIHISDVVAVNTGNALFIKLGNRANTPKYVKNVYISNVKVDVPLTRPDAGYPYIPNAPGGGAYPGNRNLTPSSITGLPGYMVENVVLENIEINFEGGGKTSVANISESNIESVNEAAGAYPEFSMFGELPATGLYVRHVDRLNIKNFTCNVEKDDYRSALVFDDVRNLYANGLQLNQVFNRAPILLNKVCNYSINDVTLSNSVADTIKVLKNCSGELVTSNTEFMQGDLSRLNMSVYPNPVNASTKVYFNLPGQGDVKIEVLNLAGISVLKLLDEYLLEGQYSFDLNTEQLGSGSFVLKLQTNGQQVIRKIISI
jgi:polygalacturonase